MAFGKNHFPIKGRTVLVAGGSQGAGLEVAKLLANKEAAHIVIASRSAQKLKNAVEEINKCHDSSENKPLVNYVAGDLGSYKGCESTMDETIGLLNGEIPDIVVCCVGSSVPKLFVDLTPEELELGIKTNYNPALFLSHVLLSRISSLSPVNGADGGVVAATKKFPSRHLVLFSSVLAHFSFIGYSQYSPLKAALNNLVYTIRQEAALYNLRVTPAFPGNFMSQGFLEEEKTKPKVTKMIEGPSDAIPASECARLVVKQLQQGNESATTDWIGYVLTCLTPRAELSWDWPLQVFLAMILMFASPIAHLIFKRDIKLHYQSEEQSKGDSLKED
ncbi:3-dehydrosphinganine reductase [Saccharomycopsis crataegensis]|uniref:3-ketodihydrosphingosine reductase TSC10 n=1 Tax=Saccharomycopsis crataegensis TaxID=43959 RepID=A0AAV5QUB8_9ASCO|nr:3-dehydrosphinganine reductase [Saccharomycopsis crataegensis]